ncbi:MAG: hypothetical protein ABJN98_14450 [Roseibium sp.]
MKAMLVAFAAIVVITIGASQVLKQVGFSSAEQATSSSVRLDPGQLMTRKKHSQ